MTRGEYLDAMTDRLLAAFVDTKVSGFPLRREIRRTIAEVERDGRGRAINEICKALERVKAVDGYEVP